MPNLLVPYTDGETQLEGFAAYTIPERRPLVILCHAGGGRDKFICEKAEMMARWGYVGFALDIYGKGVLGKSIEESAKLKQPFLDDRFLLHQRLMRALDTAQTLPHVDVTKIAAVGMGFGGLCALDYARSGPFLRGAVSVYGRFDPLPPKLNKPVQAKILVLHGYEDQIVKQEQLTAFADEMTKQQVDWQAHLFSNTMHSYMNPTGDLFNPVSAHRSWHAIQAFLEEIFSN